MEIPENINTVLENDVDLSPNDASLIRQVFASSSNGEDKRNLSLYKLLLTSQDAIRKANLWLQDRISSESEGSENEVNSDSSHSSAPGTHRGVDNKRTPDLEPSETTPLASYGY